MRSTFAISIFSVLVAGGGCATHKAASSSTEAAATAKVSRQEQAAALFEAATHRDKKRIMLLVDWTRYRLTWVWSRAAADHAEATTGLSQIEADPEPPEAYVDMAANDLMQKLQAVASGPQPPRAEPGVANAQLGELRNGPPQTKYPALPRLWELTRDALDGADEVTYVGAKKVTLVFVGDRLAGVLDAR